MSFALRLDDLADRLLPPAELLEPIRFMPRSLAPEEIAVLKKRAAVARRFLEQVASSGREIRNIAERLESRLASGHTYPPFALDGELIDVLACCDRIIGKVKVRLPEQKERRSTAERLGGPDRAAALGFLDPLIEGIEASLALACDVERAVLDFGRKSSGIDDGGWFGKSARDRFINSHAAHAYARIAQEETGLPCEAGWVELCGEFFNELRIHVPADLALPHRHLKPALDRVHERVAGIHPRYRGRITFEFVPNLSPASGPIP